MHSAYAPLFGEMGKPEYTMSPVKLRFPPEPTTTTFDTSCPVISRADTLAFQRIASA